MSDNPYLKRIETARDQDLQEEQTRTRALVDIADALQRIATVLETPATKKKGNVAKRTLKLLGTV